jgi:glycosyltransferase involved in cell wall biosynthesis
VDEFVATVRALAERGIRVRPLIVGDGPAHGRFETLQDVVFTGHLAGPELGRAVASADILLHPSRTEAFGNVVLEAMASGLAIACADAESARALAGCGRGIVICAPGQFVDAVAELCRNAHSRRALGSLARQESSRFDWDEASRSVLAAYESVTAA